MRILHIDTETGLRGGEFQVLFLMEGLRDKGDENLLVVSEGSPLIEKVRPVTNYIVTIKPQRVFDILNMLRIYRFVKSSNPDIVHLHTSLAHTIGGIPARLCGVPIVVTRRVDFPIRSLFKYNHLADKIISISEAIKRVLLRGGVREEKIVVIPSGIDIKRFDSIRNTNYLYREFQLLGVYPIIGTIAHLTDHKGHIYLLKAIPIILKQFPDSSFLFVGDGELKKPLKKKAEELRIDKRVIFTGFREDIPEILSILDLFVLPSHLEGLCTSLMDALYMKVPVVATTAGGIPEVIEHKKCGLLVPPKNPSLLAEAVIQLLKDRGKRERFVDEGKKKVLEQFTTAKMVERTQNVYQQLCSSSL